MAAKIYTNKEAPITPLKKKTLAVIGFGSQGHAHALNLKDSGLKVVIGLYKKSKSREVAKKLGFEVMDTADAVKAADVIFVAVPDTVIPEVYAKDIAPNLSKGKTLLFSHGFAIHFGLIKPPADVDVILDEMRAYTAALLPTVGSDLSHAEALEELQVVTIKAFARCLEQRRR